MKIAIIETGRPPGELAGKYPSYPAMFEKMLEGEGFSFSAVAVEAAADLPAPDAFDGLLITGSPAGVYEGHAWIGPLERLVRSTAAAGKPQIGICFGHQLMAQAFGGEVSKSDKGWGVGVHEYDVHEQLSWMRPALRRIACAVSHQDQVIVPPDGARVLAGSTFCPHGVLSYAQGPAVSFQPHPEFEHGFARDLLSLRRGRMATAVADEGFASLLARSDRQVIAGWIASFFKANE